MVHLLWGVLPRAILAEVAGALEAAEGEVDKGKVGELEAADDGQEDAQAIARGPDALLVQLGLLHRVVVTVTAGTSRVRPGPEGQAAAHRGSPRWRVSSAKTHSHTRNTQASEQAR